MQALSHQTVDTLSQMLAENGHNPAHALRILKSYWRGDADLNTDPISVSRDARDFLARRFASRASRVIGRHESADGTIKLLLSLNESSLPVRDMSAAAETIECVLMPSHRADRSAVCVSSQIGCAMGCDFCASTKSGLMRNLGIGEIVEQFMHLQLESRRTNRRIATLVFMGMGEPMHNLDNVIPAIELLSQQGLGSIARRAITVSTVGIVPGIDSLADADLGVTLALSLHAPDDATRSRLIPSNRRWPVAEVMEAARRFQSRRERPVNIEYCLLADVNDSDDHAAALAKLMDGFRAHVNLIPYNAIGAGLSGTTYRRPSDERIMRFTQMLRDSGVVTHVRITRGDDVSAACGQLRQLTGFPIA